MKTPEEVKQSIRICAILDENHDCRTCPRFPDEYTDCSNALLLDALSYIEQLEAAQPKWISVKDRLPEKLNENNQVYLTEEVIGFDGEGYYIGQFKCYKYDGHLTFFTGNCFMNDITHWMPLPEPPKEDEA